MAMTRATDNRRPRGARASPRSKRAEIIATATEQFGHHGYEHSKWADIAQAVGVGSTALYHYFESKLHCLYVIQAEAVQADREKFDRITAEREDFRDALTAVLNSAFDLSEHEVLRNRVLVAEQALVGLHRTSPREEEARQLARSHIRDLEFAWATFLTRGMEQGVIPEVDPRLLARAVLGLCNSVWHWYRPRGRLSLDDVRAFYVDRCLAVAGVPVEISATPAKKPVAKRRSPRKAA
jgi:AcrR family transcriptional regulator